MCIRLWTRYLAAFREYDWIQPVFRFGAKSFSGFRSLGRRDFCGLIRVRLLAVWCRLEIFDLSHDARAISAKINSATVPSKDNTTASFARVYHSSRIAFAFRRDFTTPR